MSDNQAHHIASTFSQAISQIVENPDGRVEELDLFSISDRDWVWERNEVEPESVDSCIHELISQRCLTQLEDEAVCSWDGRFTYADLDDLSSRLASHLVRKFEIRLGEFIPICFEKSRWTVLAILAVIKAGGAFVLLDSTYPFRRLQEICSSVSTRLIITSERNTGIGEKLASKVVTVGDYLHEWHKTSPEWSSFSSVKPYHPLYAVFTSGSTGRPKGVIIQHSSYCSGAKAHSRACFLSKHSRVLQFSSYAFDVSIAEVLTTLFVGGCVCIPSEIDRSNDIGSVIRQLRVNFLQLTPSVIRLLHPDDVPSVRTVVLGGETMSRAEIATWAHRVRLVTAYGPAECSIFSTVQSSFEGSLGLDPANIGTGTGAICWITDPSNPNKLASVGAVGELLIEGSIVGQGYLNDENRTRSVFIESPLWLKSIRQGRLYRTGDLVRYNPDGSIKYVGRKDTQIKLRGQRIELQEVEGHIQGCLGRQRDVIVDVVPMNGSPKPVLIAFIRVSYRKNHEAENAEQEASLFAAPYEHFRLDIIKVESHLRNVLPDYMVPAVFIPLARLPLTPTGKTDRRFVHERATKLSQEEYNVYTATTTATRAPSTELEWKVRSIFAQVLNLKAENINLESSFFRLGGDSITAMQVTARCRVENIDITVQDIFQNKSVALLAACARVTKLATLNKDEDYDVPFDLSPIQEMFFDSTSQKCGFRFNQSFFLRLTRHKTSSAMASAVKTVVDCHSMLRARFKRNEQGRWVQVVMPVVTGSYRYDGHRVTTRHEASKLAAFSQKSIDIENGPVFAVEFIEIEDEGQFLFLVAHHLIIDLVSWRIILSDLEELLQTGLSISGEKPTPFQTWCRMQAEYSREYLVPQRALPFSLPPIESDFWCMEGQPNTYRDLMQENFFLDERITSGFLGDCNKTFRTKPVEILHAAILDSFTRIFHTRAPPVIFNEGHGREPWDPAIDLSRTVGWFTTMWPTQVAETFENVADMVCATKDSRRLVPNNGWSYFSSRYLNDEGKKAFGSCEPVEITLNYLGLYQQFETDAALFQQVDWTVSEAVLEVDADIQRFSLIDISASIRDGCLHLSFGYNCHMNSQDAIKEWIKECKISLEKAVQQLIGRKPDYSLNDFPLLPLTYSGLRNFANAMNTKLGISTPEEVEDAYPCSPIQRGILLSQAKNVDDYQVCSTWKIHASSHVDLHRLQRAWQKVVNRHSILRTFFIESFTDEGYFDQVVLRSISTKATIIACDNNDPMASLSDHKSSYSEGMLPLHRLTLCKTNNGTIFCKLEISHLMIDAASMAILMRDFTLAYEDRLSKVPGPRYSDYLLYIRTLPASTSLDYWKNYVAGLEPCLFPKLTDRVPVSNGNQLQSAFVELEAASELHDFCETFGFTMSNLFQLAWALVLRSYTGLDTVCFGYITSGRDIPVADIENALGPFINMLTYRANLEEKTSILKMLEKNQGDFIRSLSHQHLPLADVLHSMNMSGQSLFNTTMSLQSSTTSVEYSNDSGIVFEAIKGHDPTEVRSIPRSRVVQLNYEKFPNFTNTS